MKRLCLMLALATVTLFAGCDPEAKRASDNMSVASKNFELNRRCVFYNGITGDYIMTIEGMLSVTTEDNKLEVMVKTGAAAYKKHYLGLSHNVTYFVEQVDSAHADPYHYRVIWRPTNIVPDVEVKDR